MELKEFYGNLGGDYAAVLGRFSQEERVVRFLRLFPADENFGLLTASLEKGDWPTAFRAVHSIKGVALNLGLTALVETSSRLTECLRGGSPAEDPGPLYEAVRAEYEKTIAAIAALAEA